MENPELDRTIPELDELNESATPEDAVAGIERVELMEVIRNRAKELGVSLNSGQLLDLSIDPDPNGTLLKLKGAQEK